MNPCPERDKATKPLVPLLLGADWHEDYPGGLHRYHAELFAALRDAGLHPQGVVIGPARNAPVGVVAGGRGDQRLAVRLWKFARVSMQVESRGVTVVDAHLALYALWPVRFGWLRRLPLVVHFQGPWADESLTPGQHPDWRISAKRAIETSVYRRAQVIVVLSAAFKQVLIERYGIPPWFIEVIPPGIDLGKFVPGDRNSARTSLGVTTGAALVVVVRRLIPRTGVDILIEAWALFRPSVSDTLLIVGDGPEGDRLKKLATTMGVGSSVQFLGKVDEETLVRCYQAGDVSVVPSLALEGFGLVVFESLACGTPVIVTDSGGLPEGVLSLDPSLIVPAGDPESLAKRLRIGLSHPEALPASHLCRRHAESFGWPAIAERHRAVYSRAVTPTEKRLRVVFLDHCAKLSGGELALLHLLPALDVDCHVILGEDGPLVDKLRAVGVSVEVLAIAGAAGSLGRERVRLGGVPVAVLTQTARYVACLARRLRRFKPDLVHTNSLKAALYGGAAARLVSIPVVWHVRDRLADDYLPSAACRLVRFAARVFPAAIIANSSVTLATLGRAGAGGVAIASPLGFPPAMADRPLTPGPLRVGMVGRLSPWKGQHVFLDAFARAFPYGSEEAVIIGASLFGADGYAQALERQVVTLGLEGRVEFRGFRDRIEEELGRLDILVHSSTIPEPFGQVVVEGMAVGLPVIAADGGGPAEVITHERNGLLYAPGDADALAQALLRLTSDQSLRERLGAAARLRAEDFTAQRIGPEVMAVYHRVTAGGTRYGRAFEPSPPAQT